MTDRRSFIRQSAALLGTFALHQNVAAPFPEIRQQADLAGRVLRTERIDPSVGAHTLQIGSLQNGFYILSISDQQDTVQHRAKFVVRH